MVLINKFSLFVDIRSYLMLVLGENALTQHSSSQMTKTKKKFLIPPTLLIPTSKMVIFNTSL
jgi:hypothetical protein